MKWYVVTLDNRIVRVFHRVEPALVLAKELAEDTEQSVEIWQESYKKLLWKDGKNYDQSLGLP